MPAFAEKQAGAAAEDRPGPFTPAGFLVMILAMGAEAVILFVLLKPAPIAIATRSGSGGAAAEHSLAELMAPTVIMQEEVIVSVPAGGAGTEFRTAVLSVAIKLGKAEGRDDEELDLGYLRKVYVPRVLALMPKVRHMLISMVGKKSVQELRRAETQEPILNNIKKAMTETLHSHGVEKRIREVYWHSFHFD